MREPAEDAVLVSETPMCLGAPAVDETLGVHRQTVLATGVHRDLDDADLGWEACDGHEVACKGLH